MIVRPARPSDLSRLIGLFREEIAYQRRLSPFFDLTPGFQWARFAARKLRDPDETVLVADRDGQLLGYVNVRAPRPARPGLPGRLVRRWAQWRKPPSIVRRGAVGSIEDCYVQPQFQRQGIGRALVAEGLRWLRARGATCIELAVAAANVDGRGFWEKQGFSVYRVLMSKRVE